MIYTVRTRNWNARPEVTEKLDKSLKWGVMAYGHPDDPHDQKYWIETRSKLLAELIFRFFKRFEAESGGMTYMDTNRRRF